MSEFFGTVQYSDEVPKIQLYLRVVGTVLLRILPMPVATPGGRCGGVLRLVFVLEHSST